VIAITFALPAESSAFLRDLSEKTSHNENGIRTVRGRIDDHWIEVLHTGVGETVCRQRMALFLQDRQPSYVISSGFAGAITNQLQVGSVLLARNFSTLAIVPSAAVQVAELHTSATMLGSEEERQQIAKSTGAAAVDMETKFIARACAEHALPFLSLRVISDSPAEPFPAPPEILFSIEQQRAELVKIGAFFLSRPHRALALFRFAKRIVRARKILAKAIIDIVRNSNLPYRSI